MALDYQKELEAVYGTTRAPTQSMQTFIGELVGSAPKKTLRAKTVGRLLGGTSARGLSFAGAQYEPGGSLGENLYRSIDQKEVEKAKKGIAKSDIRLKGAKGTPHLYKASPSVSGAGYNVRDR